MDDPDQPIVTQPTLTLLSWNVYRNYRAARIAASLRAFVARHTPDVLLIQEAPVYDTHPDARAFADLDAFDGYHRFYAPVHEIARRSRRLPFAHSGQLVLSRHAFAETRVDALPAARSRRRAARSGTVTRNVAYARFRLGGGGTLGVYNVHLENRTLAAGRAVQVRHLLDLVRQRDDRVVVVGGDFNTFLTSALETGLRLFARDGFVNLFSARPRFAPRLVPRLDYFMVRGAAEARATALRSRGSDHAPILATIRL